jgi:hypothetical protein
MEPFLLYIIFVLFLIFIIKILSIISRIIIVIIVSILFPIIMNRLGFAIPLTLDTFIFYVVLGVALLFIYWLTKFVYKILKGIS